MIKEWTRHDLDAPAEWLNTLPQSRDTDSAIAWYAAIVASEDPVLR